MKVPRFSERAQLVRYVDKDQTLSGNRPAVAAFLPDIPSDDPDSDHLSVNSLEVESMKEIAKYYKWKWRVDKAACCVHKVHDYTDAGRKAGVSISYDRSTSSWQFQGRSSKSQDAYKHRPVKAYGDPPHGSPSHCGVEFSRILKQHDATKFARRLSAKGKFHLV